MSQQLLWNGLIFILSHEITCLQTRAPRKHRFKCEHLLKNKIKNSLKIRVLLSFIKKNKNKGAIIMLFWWSLFEHRGILRMGMFLSKWLPVVTGGHVGVESAAHGLYGQVCYLWLPQEAPLAAQRKRNRRIRRRNRSWDSFPRQKNTKKDPPLCVRSSLQTDFLFRWQTVGSASL